MTHRGGGRPRREFLRAAVGLASVSVVLTLLAGVPTFSGPPSAASAGASAARIPTGVPLSAYLPSTGNPSFTLSISDNPGSICAMGGSGCPAGTGVTRVQLSASADNVPQPFWPDVQVVFVVETTAYDGVWGYVDPTYGLDPCAPVADWAPLCEESNGVPFFVAHAQQIANSIQAENPHSKVSFAMVDYYDAWGSAWDDQDGPEYNVDIGRFVPGDQFGAAVTSTFQQTQLAGSWYNWDQDLDNNFLDSSSITALYGAIVGSQLNWVSGAHHVIVWMGSTAPRDPAYLENYCVSPSAWNQWGRPASCYGQSCEPGYAFPSGASPQCEGWVRSQDGQPSDSIAALAKTAPSCVDSVGGVCTVDTIDLATTPTDPWSRAWPAEFADIGGGPGGPAVVQNVARVIEAGCDLADATGGTWDGPAWASCPDGQQGTLEIVPHGPVNKPNLNNPGLLQAFRQVGFGPVYKTEFAHGTDVPMFTFVPIGSIAVAPDPEWTVACATATGFSATCQTTPTVLRVNGVIEYGWNWSTNASQNIVHDGDVWTASFFVQAIGPPYATVPIDACITAACYAAGSGTVVGLYTRATYLPYTNTSTLVESWGVASVQVQVPLTTSSPPAPAPAPPFLLPPPIPAILPVAAAAAVPLTAQVGVGSVSVQAIAAGLLAAGFLRVSMRNRPIAVAVVQRSGATPSSRFTSESKSSDVPSRWE